MTRNDLYDVAFRYKKLLEASPETVVMTMDDMLSKEELLLEKNITRTDEDGNTIQAIYLPLFYFAEIGETRC